MFFVIVVVAVTLFVCLFIFFSRYTKGVPFWAKVV